MLPNILLSPNLSDRHNVAFWRSSVSPHSPSNIATSGITQPAMLAEAVVQVGKKLKATERRTWYQKMLPALIRHHQWLYSERDPRNNGLVLQIHPWETGLDNTPPWMSLIHRGSMPNWIKVVRSLHLDKVMGLMRKDYRFALPGQRLSTIDGLSLYSIQRMLRRHRYDINEILKLRIPLIEDVSFNSILARANQHLIDIAEYLRQPLPAELQQSIQLTRSAIVELWDESAGQFYSRNFKTKKLIRTPSIGTLLPLYSGCISKQQATKLVALLKNDDFFNTTFPAPSVPVNSRWFSQHLYWQGPTWVNTNWLIIDGLERYGFDEEARHIRRQTIKLISKNGPYEYFSPKDGTPAGAANFSWTAALTLDLLNR